MSFTIVYGLKWVQLHVCIVPRLFGTVRPSFKIEYPTNNVIAGDSKYFTPPSMLTLHELIGYLNNQ